MRRRKPARGKKYAHGGIHRPNGSNKKIDRNPKPMPMDDTSLQNSTDMNMMRKGGRLRKPVNRKMARGGRVNGKFQTGGTTYMNSGCRMHTSKYDCDNASGCLWDFNNSCCK